jgi:hypothetical protein
MFVIAVVIILSAISLCFNTLNNLWAYLILICESMGMLFVETTMECFEGSKWCENDIKYQTGAILILIVYALIVWIRSQFYYPFYDNFNYISMSSSSIVLCDFAYKLFFGLITNLSFISEI